MTKIKICGLKRDEDVKYVNKFKADYAGFVLYYPKSSRNLSIETAERLLQNVDKTIKTVAVTVSPTAEQLLEIEERGFDYIQVHGELRADVLELANIPIIRAMNVSQEPSCQNVEVHDKIIGYVFDGKISGSGKTFDWSVLKDFERGGRLMMLAGGLDEENVCDGICCLNPDIVDVSSGVEGADGFKSAEKIEQFIEKIRKYEE